jgi:hypothetical protein
MPGRVILLAFLIGAAGAAKPLAELPASLDYSSWKPLTAGPQVIGGPPSWLCASLTEERLRDLRASAMQTHGSTHVGYIRVYANDLAFSALERGDKTFPVGAGFAKEKSETHGGPVDGVAFMIKRPKAERPDSGGWEFDYYPKIAGASYSACIECHRTGNTEDYVYARRTDAPAWIRADP